MTLTPDEVNVIENDDVHASVDDALKIAFKYGQIDGSHHKAWVIDQMVRALLGSEEAYKAWIRHYVYDEETDSVYEWDKGIAP